MSVLQGSKALFSNITHSKNPIRTINPQGSDTCGLTMKILLDIILKRFHTYFVGRVSRQCNIGKIL